MMKKVLFTLLACSSIVCYAQIITTIAGGATGHGGYWGDGGPATAAQFGPFGSILIDIYGDIYW